MRVRDYSNRARLAPVEQSVQVSAVHHALEAEAAQLPQQVQRQDPKYTWSLCVFMKFTNTIIKILNMKFNYAHLFVIKNVLCVFEAQAMYLNSKPPILTNLGGTRPSARMC